MLEKKLRLTKRGSFAYVYRSGQSVSTPALRMLYAKSASLKIGFSVSNKIGKAVLRNRLKRQMRAAVRNRLEEIKRSYQIIFVAKKPLVASSFKEIEQEIAALIKKAAVAN